jgi:hypothetical protein
MIDVIVKEEFEKLSIDDPIDRLITYPANKEFERFIEQLELEILKSEEKETDHGSQSQNHELQNWTEQETEETVENSQNYGPQLSHE